MAGRLAWNWNRMSTAAQAVAFFRGPGVTTGLTITAAAGRFSDAGLVVTNAQGYVSHPLANEAEFVVGFSVKGTGPCCLWRAMDDATEQCSLWLRSDGKLEARRGSTVLGTGTAVMSATIHRWVELYIVISATVGKFQVFVDGNLSSLDINVTGADTNQTANEYATQWRLGEGAAASGTVAFTIGDGYFLDATGGVNDDVLGSVRVKDSVASAAGTTSQFTANTGNTYECIDDTTPDGDTTYITSSTSGHKSTFAWGNLSGTITSIPFIQLSSYIQKTDAGARTVEHVTRVSTTEDQGAAFTPSAGAYDYAHSPFDVQPDASAWDQTDFNAAEFGLQIAS